MAKETQIKALRNLPNQLRDLVADLSPEQLTTNYIEGEWTIAQNVHHLFDAHTNSYQLCRRILSEDEAKLSWLNQNEVAASPDSQRADIEPSLRGLEGTHTRWADMFSTVTNWEKFGVSIKSGKQYTLAKLLDSYVKHGEKHLQQIQDVLDAMHTTLSE